MIFPLVLHKKIQNNEAKPRAELFLINASQLIILSRETPKRAHDLHSAQ